MGNTRIAARNKAHDVAEAYWAQLRSFIPFYLPYLCFQIQPGPLEAHLHSQGVLFSSRRSPSDIIIREF